VGLGGLELPFLVGVVDPAKTLRIHPELSRHLNVGMREAMPLARVDPNLKPFGNPFSSHVSYAPPAQ
jgi:hypothetical protein